MVRVRLHTCCEGSEERFRGRAAFLGEKVEESEDHSEAIEGSGGLMGTSATRSCSSTGADSSRIVHIA